MPKGVEHPTYTYTFSAPLTVELPLMPKGVEHFSGERLDFELAQWSYL